METVLVWFKSSAFFHSTVLDEASHCGFRVTCTYAHNTAAVFRIAAAKCSGGKRESVTTVLKACFLF